MQLNADEQLYLERHLYYNHIKSDGTAANVIAAERNFSADSVRGRLQRGNTQNANLELMKQASLIQPYENPSEVRQQELMDYAMNTFDAGMNARPNDVEVAAISATDIHLPFQRNDATELTLAIQHDVQAEYFTVGHDLVDNDGYGRWDDTRTPRGKLWASDQANVRRAESGWYKAVKAASPKNVQLIEILGNHDVWFYRHSRSLTPQLSEEIIADYMQWKSEQGVLTFSNGEENYIELNDGLVLWHGQFAQSSALVNAKNTIKHFMKNGKARSVVVGHTHRPSTIQGHTTGYEGVTFYNSPCLSRIDRVPYMKRAPEGWKLGITVSYFIPHTSFERSYVIEYYERGQQLVAHFNG